MILTSLRTNQLSPGGMEWYKRYLAAFDTGDSDAFIACLDENCVIQANNDLPLYGLSAIRPAMQRYINAFEAIEHEPLNIYGTDHQFGVELLCHYVRHDAAKTRITVPAGKFVDRGPDGLVTSIRVYIDAAPAWDFPH